MTGQDDLKEPKTIIIPDELLNLDADKLNNYVDLIKKLNDTELNIIFSRLIDNFKLRDNLDYSINYIDSNQFNISFIVSKDVFLKSVDMLKYSYKFKKSTLKSYKEFFEKGKIHFFDEKVYFKHYNISLQLEKIDIEMIFAIADFVFYAKQIFSSKYSDFLRQYSGELANYIITGLDLTEAQRNQMIFAEEAIEETGINQELIEDHYEKALDDALSLKNRDYNIRNEIYSNYYKDDALVSNLYLDNGFAIYDLDKGKKIAEIIINKINDTEGYLKEVKYQFLDTDWENFDRAFLKKVQPKVKSKKFYDYYEEESNIFSKISSLRLEASKKVESLLMNQDVTFLRDLVKEYENDNKHIDNSSLAVSENIKKEELVKLIINDDPFSVIRFLMKNKCLKVDKTLSDLLKSYDSEMNKYINVRLFLLKEIKKIAQEGIKDKYKVTKCVSCGKSFYNSSISKSKCGYCRYDNTSEGKRRLKRNLRAKQKLDNE